MAESLADGTEVPFGIADDGRRYLTPEQVAHDLDLLRFFADHRGCFEFDGYVHWYRASAGGSA